MSKGTSDGDYIVNFRGLVHEGTQMWVPVNYTKSGGDTESWAPMAVVDVLVCVWILDVDRHKKNDRGKGSVRCQVWCTECGHDITNPHSTRTHEWMWFWDWAYQ